ncbi:MAG: hypothetical protein JO230_04835 [Xanthobacteraceae bacterium]|nr:hypothetical protein [Xanthobacteraceae bacterium]
MNSTGSPPTSCGAGSAEAATDESGDDQPLFDRFTLFFDFLGTSEATRWPKERLNPFVDLLISIAQIQSEQDVEGNPQDDGSYRIWITPQVTTFSDNIVVSYPSLEDKTSVPYGVPKHLKFEAHWAKFMCQDAIRILSGVAELGLRIGVLVRGGFTFGQLHHNQGAVFGEALVEANRIEKSEAIYPRVLVSESIMQKLDGIPEADRTFLLRDVDGRWHLNYFADMIQHSTNGPIDDEQAQRWKSAHLVTINAAIEGLAHDPHRRGKWVWFKARFEEAYAHVQSDKAAKNGSEK